MAAEKKSIEGQWLPLADTGDEGVPLTNADLDDMVRNYQPAAVADQLPVHFGPAKGDGPVVARVSDLRRDGSVLSGKFSNVDPRLDQLVQAKKLGLRGRRSLGFARTPEAGASLTGYGFLPPRHYHSGALQESPATDADLSSLAAADTAGETLQFNANDAGRIEVIMTAEQLAKPNSQRLSDLAKKRQQENKVSFGEALAEVARERPELTLPDGMTAPRATHHAGAEAFRFESNSEKLSDLAKKRQREDRVSFGEALSQVASENPELTAPGTTIDFGERRPESNGEQLTRLAKERQRADRRISFGEALAEVARERPELTLPDMK